MHLRLDQWRVEADEFAREEQHKKKKAKTGKNAEEISDLTTASTIRSLNLVNSKLSPREQYRLIRLLKPPKTFNAPCRYGGGAPVLVCSYAWNRKASRQ